MNPAFRPTVIVLASGRGERFKASGGTTHKLHDLLAGKAVLQRRACTPPLARFATMPARKPAIVQA